MPPSDGCLAYNGDVYLRSAREVYRLHLADGEQTRIYSGAGVTELAPCGAADICLVDAVEAGGTTVVAVHDGHVKWTMAATTATRIAPIGRSLRVWLGPQDGTSLVLDEQGREVLRLAETGLIRLNAGNLLGYRMSADGTNVAIVGIPAAAMRQNPLGTVAVDRATTVAAQGSTVATIESHQLVVYRFG